MKQIELNPLCFFFNDDQLLQENTVQQILKNQWRPLVATTEIYYLLLKSFVLKWNNNNFGFKKNVYIYMFISEINTSEAPQQDHTHTHRFCYVNLLPNPDWALTGGWLIVSSYHSIEIGSKP